MSDNDDLPTEELPDVQMGDAEDILLDVIDLITKAPNVPLSSTPRIDRQEVIALLEDAIACMPQEVREARFMLKEKEISSTARSEKLMKSSRQPARRPSAWCNAPRWCAHQRPAPARSSTKPRRPHVA
ncbi:MAG: hypothetical protein EBQ57_07600 [Actinobacteria bacterium]|nr:hypothetical protein [Actinomycetota bacterium]